MFSRASTVYGNFEDCCFVLPGVFGERCQGNVRITSWLFSQDIQYHFHSVFHCHDVAAVTNVCQNSHIHPLALGRCKQPQYMHLLKYFLEALWTYTSDTRRLGFPCNRHRKWESCLVASLVSQEPPRAVCSNWAVVRLESIGEKKTHVKLYRICCSSGRGRFAPAR